MGFFSWYHPCPIIVIESQNREGPVNRELGFLAQLFLHHDKAAAMFLQAKLQSVYLSNVPSYLTHKEDNEIRKLLCLRQRLTPDLKSAVHHFLAGNLGLI